MNDLLHKQRLRKKLIVDSKEKVLFEYLRTLNNYVLIRRIENRIPNLSYWSQNIFEFIELFNSHLHQDRSNSKWNVFIEVMRELNNVQSGQVNQLRLKMKPVFDEFKRVYLKPKEKSEGIIRRVLRKDIKEKLGGHNIKLNSAGEVPKVKPITAKQTKIMEDFVHQSEPRGPFMGHGVGHEYQTGYNKYKGGASVNQHHSLNPRIPAFMGPPPPGGPKEMPGIHPASGALPRGGQTSGPPPVQFPLQPIGPQPPGGPLRTGEMPKGIHPGRGHLYGGQPMQATMPSDYFVIDQNEPEGFEIIIKDRSGKQIKIRCRDIEIEDKKKVR